jgi:hypothetical protein
VSNPNSPSPVAAASGSNVAGTAGFVAGFFEGIAGS